VREELTPERLGVLDEFRAIGHGSHHAAQEGGELVGRSRRGRSLAGVPEQGLTVRPAMGVGDRRPRLAEQYGG
jgi:hypothetical protein